MIFHKQQVSIFKIHEIQMIHIAEWYIFLHEINLEAQGAYHTNLCIPIVSSWATITNLMVLYEITNNTVTLLHIEKCACIMFWEVLGIPINSYYTTSGCMSNKHMLLVFMHCIFPISSYLAICYRLYSAICPPGLWFL